MTEYNNRQDSASAYPQSGGNNGAFPAGGYPAGGQPAGGQPAGGQPGYNPAQGQAGQHYAAPSNPGQSPQGQVPQGQVPQNAVRQAQAAATQVLQGGKGADGAQSAVGRVFNGRYQIQERVGVGGMAEVYRAIDTVLGRKVAVKIMLPRYADEADFAYRFKQEAAAAANLQSPFIVNVYDWGRDNGTYYIVMEYVNGSDLKSGIKQRGAINQRKVAEIGMQVCQALTVAHNQDIIHRDIKPQNIMVQPDGNIKVLDFGIARAKNSSDPQTSTVLGTAHYISPEQAQGKPLTASSDIYSLGVVLYEAATGKLPFDGPDAISVATMQVNDIPLAPRQVNPKIDPVFESIICKAMSKNPSERFATANDMRLALKDYLSGRGTSYTGAFNAAETAVLSTPATPGAATYGASAYNGAGKTSVMPIQHANGHDQYGHGDYNRGDYGNDARSYRADNQYPQNQRGNYNNYEDYDEYNDGGSKKKSKKGLIIGIIAALVVIGVAAFLIFNNTGNEVPDVTGKSLDAATKVIEDAGFAVGSVSEAYNSDFEEDKICAQDPNGGSHKREGTKINLIISLGKEMVEVPDLSDMTAAEAQAALKKAGLEAYAGEAKYSSDVDVNKVLSQEPKAGEKIEKGEKVTYILSLGKESVNVPHVVGESKDSAVSTLQAAGFNVTIDYENSSSVASGKVIRQSPSEGKVDKGSSVTIVISKGDSSSAVPNVVGMSVANARTMLENYGFSVHVAGGAPDSDTVTAQDPGSGTSAASGSTVTIWGNGS